MAFLVTVGLRVLHDDDGKSLFDVDFRPLNKRIKADKWPIPNAEELVDRADGGKVFYSLDLYTRYWNIWSPQGMQEMTTFRCQEGALYSKFMPFGMKNAAKTFQFVTYIVFSYLPFVLVYICDIFIRPEG